MDFFESFSFFSLIFTLIIVIIIILLCIQLTNFLLNLTADKVSGEPAIEHSGCWAA